MYIFEILKPNWVENTELLRNLEVLSGGCLAWVRKGLGMKILCFISVETAAYLGAVTR
jgi:hypothetical protein